MIAVRCALRAIKDETRDKLELPGVVSVEPADVDDGDKFRKTLKSARDVRVRP
jgi:hypothetical protein